MKIESRTAAGEGVSVGPLAGGLDALARPASWNVRLRHTLVIPSESRGRQIRDRFAPATLTGRRAAVMPAQLTKLRRSVPLGRPHPPLKSINTRSTVRNRTVTLVDLGLDTAFNASMQFVQATLDNVNAGEEQALVDVNFVRSRDQETIWSALTTPSTVLHVMAHGDHSEEPAFVSSDGQTEITLGSVAEQHRGQGTGIAAPIVTADGCKTGIGVWQRALRDCLQGPVAYIGTNALVGWKEGTVFGAAFYGALLGRVPRAV